SPDQPGGAMDSNPFTPGFGLTPRVLAMQGTPVEDFAEALAGRRSVGERSVRISGARGVGKAVLLAQMDDVAELAGWHASTLHTSSTSMVEELRGAVAELLSTDAQAAAGSHIGGAEGGRGGV